VSDLAQFLLARVGEDEQIARAARGSGVHDDRPAVKEWIGLANPERMLVWSDARRRIVALHSTLRPDGLRPDTLRPNALAPNGTGGGETAPVCTGCGKRAPCPTLRLLALPFADHPDFREEWRP
jgi:hypothetical protein